MIHQAMFSHLFRTHLCSKQDHFHRTIFSESTCQALRSTCTWNNAEQNFWLPKACVFSGYDHVTIESQLAATTKYIAKDRRNDGLTDAPDAIPIIETSVQHINR